MRIALSAGHNVNYKYFDCGSVGNGLRECDITKETVAILKGLLQEQGHIVLDVTPYNQQFSSKKLAHQTRANLVNKFKADLYLDIHINAGGGTGSEVLLNANNKISHKYGLDITKQISADLGFRNRGVKHKPNFYSISQPVAPSIIVEGAFIDTKSDMEKLTPEKYARAIAKVFGEVKGSEDTNTTPAKELDLKNFVKDLNICVDEKDQVVKSINIEGSNYVNIRDIVKILGLEISSKGSKPIISPRLEKVHVEDRWEPNRVDKVETIKLNGDTNFFKVKDLEKLGLFKARWDNESKIVNIGK